MSVFQFFFKYLKRYRKMIILIIFFLLLESFVEITSPLILSNIIENGIGLGDSNYIFHSFVVLVFLTIIGVVGSILGSYCSASFSSRFICDLRKELFDSLLSLSFRNLNYLDINKATTVLSNDIETIGTVLSYGIGILLKVPFLFFGSLFFSFLLSRKLFLILVLLIPFMIVMIYHILKKAYPYFDTTKDALDKLNKVVRENISGKKLIKVMNAEKEENQKFEKANNHLKTQNIQAMKTITMVSPISMFFIYLAIYLVLIFGYHFLQNGTIQVGVLMAFLEYLTTILSSLLMGAMILLLCSQTWISLKRVYSLCMKKEEKEENGKLCLNNNHILLKDVAFSYGKNSENSLSSISIEIKEGEKVAVIGRCGSGKTTLLKVIAGLYQPNEGQVLIDFRPISEYKDIRNKIVYNAQKMVLFKGTIKQNILFFAKGSILNRILKISKVNSIIQKKEKGVLSHVDAYGSNLSGGEKNRISLARCLNRNFEILLLDDSLSAVDLKTEQEIISNLHKNFEDKTIIYATSRLTSLDKMDKIILLEKGKIETCGTLEDVSKNHLFKEFYELSKEVQNGR